MKEKLYIFDTTLRDGAQTHGVDFNVDEKKILASKLDELGVDYIEGGWPGANSTDTQFFNEKLKFKNSLFTAFGMTKKSGRSAENDPGLASLINADTPSICVVGKTWDFHVDVALGISNEENIDNILSEMDAVVIVTNHNDFKKIEISSFKKMKNPILIDTRGVFDPISVKQNNIIFRGLGRGDF